MAMKSILFSLFQHFKTLDFKDAVSDTFRAMIGIVRALGSRSGDATLMAAVRTHVCERCEFYDPKWKTCGTPGDTMEAKGIELKIGCWCYLPLANRDPLKDCYARANDIIDEHGQTVGWPDALRPSS